MREIERKKERERERFPPHPHPQVTKEREGKAMCFLGNREQLGKKGGRKPGADLTPLAGEGLDSLCRGRRDTYLCGGRWQHFLKVLLKGVKLVTGLA